MDFETWLVRVGEIFTETLGMNRNDFDDWEWLNAFDAGCDPTTAFKHWAEATGHAHLI